MRFLVKIIIYVIVFCTAFWYAPNDYWPWWTMDIGKHRGDVCIIQDIPVKIGNKVIVVTREYYEPI